jgi:hypothetical protein
VPGQARLDARELAREEVPLRWVLEVLVLDHLRLDNAVALPRGLGARVFAGSGLGARLALVPASPGAAAAAAATTTPPPTAAPPRVLVD